MSEFSVFFVLSRFESGGLERVHLNILPKLLDVGVQAKIVTSHIHINAESMLKKDAPVRAIGGGRLSFFLGCFVFFVLNRLI